MKKGIYLNVISIRFLSFLLRKSRHRPKKKNKGTFAKVKAQKTSYKKKKTFKSSHMYIKFQSLDKITSKKVVIGSLEVSKQGHGEAHVDKLR